MIKEIKALIKGGGDASKYRYIDCEIIAVLANRQVVLKDQAGRVAFAKTDGAYAIGDKVVMANGYVINKQGMSLPYEVQEAWV